MPPAQTRFEICAAFILAHETEHNKDGSVRVERDPADPGGTTKYGIDQRSHPHVDIANLTREQALEIYYNGEWTSCRCGNLKPPWDLAVFDAAVNIGSGRTIKLLQQSVGTTVDGFIGPKTIEAVKQAPLDELGEFLDLRESYYRGLPEHLRIRFLSGWLNRMADLRRKTTEGQDAVAV